MNRLPHIALVLVAILLLAAEQNEEELLPVPDKATITESLTLVRDLFQEEFKAAKTNAKKIELAKKILQSGIETEDDAAGRFVLLQVARDMATDVGDLETALKAIDQLENSFKLDDALAMRVKVFDKIAPKAKTITKLREPIIALALGLIDEMIAKDRFETAQRIRTLTYSIATKTRDKELVKQLRIKKIEIKSLAKEFEGVKVALATLETNPTDPKANLTVGKYRSFIKGDWKAGIPMLVLGNDEIIKSLAMVEMAMPETAAEQLKLGNDWWVLSMKATSTMVKKQLQGRAAHWYEIALPELKGLPRTIAAKRLASIPQRTESSSAGKLKTFFLDDLQEVSSQEHVKLGKHGSLGWDRNSGRFKGATPPHALSAHPLSNSPSTVVYNLGGKAHRLDTMAALWDSARPRAPLIFKVFGDGKLLWQSNPITKTGEVQNCSVDLKGVKILKLQIECTGKYNSSKPVWLMPRVLSRFTAP